MTESKRSSILVVDDRPENRTAFERVLKTLDAELLFAASGEEALAWTLRRDFAFILLDVRMPGMDGFETARLLREDADTRHVPIVFVTADAYLDTRALEGYDIGALDFIIKPVDPRILLGKARILLELHAHREDLVGKTELRYRSLFEGMAEIVLVCEAEGEEPRLTVREANPAILGKFAASAEEARDKPLGALLSGFEPDFLRDCAKIARSGGKLDRNRLRAGKGLVFRASAHSPAPGFVAILLSDITKIVAAEEETAFARRLAEESVEAKRRFLANMSHEIRTPLNGVMGMAELLRGTELDLAQREYLDDLSESAEVLLELMTAVLDQAKLEAGRWKPETCPFSPGEEAEKAVRICAHAAGGKPLALRTDVGAAGGARVQGDRAALRRILVNLVGNAIKFTKRGEVVVSLSRPEGEAGPYAFAVRDTGIGIPKDKLGRVFERFEQVDSSYTKSYGGAGLGLSLARDLAVSMGGRIDVESEEGKGSTFTLLVPLAPAATEAPAAARPDSGDGSPRNRASGLRVLVAEDNVVNALFVKTTLERDRQVVRHVNDGEQALELSSGTDFDLVLMDVQMPLMDGVACAKAIRAREADGRKRLPIIAMTGYADIEDLARCREAGMDGFITKPLSQRTLVALVAACAEGALPGRFRFTDPARPASGEMTGGVHGYIAGEVAADDSLPAFIQGK